MCMAGTVANVVQSAFATVVRGPVGQGAESCPGSTTVVWELQIGVIVITSEEAGVGSHAPGRRIPCFHVPAMCSKGPCAAAGPRHGGWQGECSARLTGFASLSSISEPCLTGDLQIDGL